LSLTFFKVAVEGSIENGRVVASELWPTSVSLAVLGPKAEGYLITFMNFECFFFALFSNQKGHRLGRIAGNISKTGQT
jgi:hypothetical protein